MEYKLVTPIPGPKSQEVYKRRKAALPSCMPSVFENIVTRAEGALIEDLDGNVMIDMCAGIGVMNIGHSNPEVIQACKDQLDKIVHPQSYTLGGYMPIIEAAEALNRITPGSYEKNTVFFNSGAEAVENAIKVARCYTERMGVVCFTNCFHGRTMMTAALNSKEKPYSWKMGRAVGNVHRLEMPYKYRTPKFVPEDQWIQYYIDQAEKYFMENVEKTDIACVILEPVLGDGGFMQYPNEFVRYLRKLCDDNGILLIADEVQAGFCRTGKFFASMFWDVEPDLITTSKALASGMPLSALTGRKEIFDKLHNGAVGGTLGGNAVSCAACVASIKVFERDNYCEKAVKVGEWMTKRLLEMQKKYKIIGDVRGVGAMQVIELVKDRESKVAAKEERTAILAECHKNGVVVIGAGQQANLIRFLPPLCITEEQVNKAMDIVDAAIAKCAY